MEPQPHDAGQPPWWTIVKVKPPTKPKARPKKGVKQKKGPKTPGAPHPRAHHPKVPVRDYYKTPMNQIGIPRQDSVFDPANYHSGHIGRLHKPHPHPVMPHRSGKHLGHGGGSHRTHVTPSGPHHGTHTGQHTGHSGHTHSSHRGITVPMQYAPGSSTPMDMSYVYLQHNNNPTASNNPLGHHRGRGGHRHAPLPVLNPMGDAVAPGDPSLFVDGAYKGIPNPWYVPPPPPHGAHKGGHGKGHGAHKPHHPGDSHHHHGGTSHIHALQGHSFIGGSSASAIFHHPHPPKLNSLASRIAKHSARHSAHLGSKHHAPRHHPAKAH